MEVIKWKEAKKKHHKIELIKIKLGKRTCVDGRTFKRKNSIFIKTFQSWRCKPYKYM
jgi:hypothetical protein